MVDNGKLSLKWCLHGAAVPGHHHLAKEKIVLSSKNAGCSSQVISEEILLHFERHIYTRIYIYATLQILINFLK